MLHGNQAYVLQLEKPASHSEDLAQPTNFFFQLLTTFLKNEGSLEIGDHKL